jgi:hypothetical protein
VAGAGGAAELAGAEVAGAGADAGADAGPGAEPLPPQLASAMDAAARMGSKSEVARPGRAIIRPVCRTAAGGRDGNLPSGA